MPHPQNEEPPSRLLVFGTVSFYLVAAMAMILANKWVLNKTTIPLFFLFVQLVIAVILLALSRSLRLIQISLKIDVAVAKALIPMILINVMGLSFNNFTLKYVDASFYQVARGLLLPITVAFSSVLLHTRPSLKILFSCAIVTSGFFIGILIDSPSTAGTIRTGGGPSMIGVIFGLMSTVTTALHAVVIKRSLDAVNGSTLQLAWYSNLLSAVILLPLVMIAGEIPGVLELLFGAVEDKSDGLSALWTFIWGSAITGVFGFLICIAGFLSIKITSPITHMVSSAVRGVVQTLLSMWLFHDVITTGRASSIAIILIGSIYYTWVKHNEAEQAKHAAAHPQRDASKLESQDDDLSPPTTPRHLHPNGNGYESLPLRDLHGRQPSGEGGLTPTVDRKHDQS